jgi:hypothetical protein
VAEETALQGLQKEMKRGLLSLSPSFMMLIVCHKYCSRVFTEQTLSSSNLDTSKDLEGPDLLVFVRPGILHMTPSADI